MTSPAFFLQTACSGQYVMSQRAPISSSGRNAPKIDQRSIQMLILDVLNIAVKTNSVDLDLDII